MADTSDSLPNQARWCVALCVLGAAVTLFFTAAEWDSPDLVKYGGFLMVAIFTCGMQISVPGITRNLPLTFLFVLLGILELTTPETIALGAIVTLVLSYWNQPRRPRLVQVILTTSVMTVASGLAERIYHSPWLDVLQLDQAVRLVAATFTLFLVNTLPLAFVIALAEDEEIATTWRECYSGAAPYYLGGAMIAEVAGLAINFVGWETVLLTGPLVYLVFRSYRLYVVRLEAEKRHAEEVSSLHLRTIEALAMAIEAKDHTTHDHLQRVQVYAMALANDLDLTEDDKEALRAAALLHDIGKLAIPEHIISKPGRLTPEEFEKMKIHPIVGAEILERVKFPYPVVPIVRAHHEKWDGSGYPYSLKGENIPIGARILSAVDCLDALATDRQYRRALPLDEAMKIVQSESGKAFDPRVVDELSQRYVELEQMALAKSAHNDARLSVDVKVSAGDAPAAGFEGAAASAPPGKDGSLSPLNSIAAARQEVQALFEIAQDLGNSLSLDETLSVLAVRLRRIVPHHSLAIWVKREGVLKPEYVTGEDFRLFSTLEIPVGSGLSGWVAENRKAILNGNPSVEPGYLNDPSKFSTLRSAVAVPLEGVNGVLGTLSIYHYERDAFTKDHLRILLAISSKIALSIENALRFRQAESSATTDYLTNLPNARSLFLHVDAELSRARRNRLPLALLVMDLNGFKQVNDRLGHMEGNKVLRAIADGLKAGCREYDYVARMGGDEFVILLPGVRPVDTDRKVAHFRNVVAEVCLELFSDESLSASIGVAHFPSDAADAEQLLAEADRRMYKEKHAGRLGRGIAPEPLDSPEWIGTIQ